MKIVMHGKGFSMCNHNGPNWETAIARALYCLEVTASQAEERAMVVSFQTGEPHWHRGTLLTGEAR